VNRYRERLLSAYVDGEVTGEERRQVEEWLRRDPEAHRAYREMVRLRDLLRRLPERPAPGDLEDRILRAARGWARRHRPEAARRAAWVGALVAAAAAVGLFPVVRGGLDRLGASEAGVQGYVWHHTAQVAGDPLVDPAYAAVVLTDAGLEQLGERVAEDGR
jgi:anti-sigma factor RsiW